MTNRESDLKLIEELYERTIKNYSQEARQAYEGAREWFKEKHGADWMVLKGKERERGVA